METQPIYIWKRAPFIRLLPPLVVGILYGYYVSFSYEVIGIIAAILVLSIIVFERLKSDIKFRFRHAPGLIFMSLMFLVGAVSLKFNDVKSKELWYGYHLENSIGLELVLKSKPQQKSKTIGFIGEVQAVVYGDTVKRTIGRAMLYLATGQRTSMLKEGDVLIARNKMKPIKNMGNPGEFDVEAYMAHQNIYHQAYLTDDDWQFTGKNVRGGMGKAIDASLGYAHSTFNRHIRSTDENALSKALLTGDRSELDRSLVDAYANTGVVHIMAISGLHLGLIYLFLIKFFNLIPVVRNHQLSKTLFVIIGIWFFALMTGASPSVMRAAVMFSFLAMGILMRRKTSTYNFWAAAAFLLLCVNPYLLFNVGFQLSFMAVLGILVVQKPIYKWIEFHNKLVDYTWQLTSVSLAAQLFTLPFCLYYFHQFPVVFVLANIVAIPLASMGLWSGMILLIAGWVPFPGKLIGAITENLFLLLNRFIRLMNEFEYSVWKGFLPGVAESISLSLLIVFMLFWLMRRSKVGLQLSLVSLLMISGLSSFRLFSVKSQNRVIVYNIQKTTAIDFVKGNRYEPIALGEMPDAGHRILTTARQFLRADNEGNLVKRVSIDRNELIIGGKVFFHVTKMPKTKIGNRKIKVDAVIISASPKQLTIKGLSEVFDAGLFIFPPSNKRYLIEKWKKECEELLLPFYDVADEGAWVVNF